MGRVWPEKVPTPPTQPPPTQPITPIRCCIPLILCVSVEVVGSVRLRKCEYGAVENCEIDEEVCVFAWSRPCIENGGAWMSEVGRDGQ